MTGMTPESIANTIRMAKVSNKTSLFVIVEGSSDSKLLQKFCDNAKVTIIVACGKERAVGAKKILSLERQVCAVVDLDFDYHLATDQPEGVFVTDVHDFEMMLLTSPALEALYAELASPEKLKQRRLSFEQTWFEMARVLGILRLLSSANRLGIKFEGVDFKRFVKFDSARMVFESQGVFDALLNTNQERRAALARLKELYNSQADSLSHHHDYLVCCGHDMVEILSMALRVFIGSLRAQDATCELLERGLRLAYPRDKFHSTRLCQSLKEWASASDREIFYACSE